MRLVTRLSLDELAAAAVRFPQRGPMSLDDAWDGVALAVYLTRTRLPPRAREGRRIDKAFEMIRQGGGPAAFRMMAAWAAVAYHLHLTRIHLSTDYHPTDEQIVEACTRLTKAAQERRNARRRYRRAA